MQIILTEQEYNALKSTAQSVARDTAIKWKAQVKQAAKELIEEIGRVNKTMHHIDIVANPGGWPNAAQRQRLEQANTAFNQTIDSL